MVISLIKGPIANLNATRLEESIYQKSSGDETKYKQIVSAVLNKELVKFNKTSTYCCCCCIHQVISNGSCNNCQKSPQNEESSDDTSKTIDKSENVKTKVEDDTKPKPKQVKFADDIEKGLKNRKADVQNQDRKTLRNLKIVFSLYFLLAAFVVGVVIYLGYSIYEILTHENHIEKSFQMFK